MIWRYCLDVERTVILDHNFYRDGNIPRAEILEDCPIMLHICQDARHFALAMYKISDSVLLEGRDLKTYLTRTQFRARLKRSHVKPAPTVKKMYAQFSRYMNEHLEEGAAFPKSVEYGRRFRPLLYPRWFDTTHDTLLIRPFKIMRETRNYGLIKLDNLKQCQLQSLAIKLLPQLEDSLVLQKLFPGPQEPYVLYSLWPDVALWPDQEVLKFFSSLKSLMLLCPRKGEVMHVSRCTTGVLKNPSDQSQPWDMSFSLVTKSQQFKEELGAQMGERHLASDCSGKRATLGTNDQELGTI